MKLMELCVQLGVKGFRPSTKGTSINALNADGRVVLNIAVEPGEGFSAAAWYSANKIRPVTQERDLPSGIPTCNLAPAFVQDEELALELEADAAALAPAKATASKAPGLKKRARK